VVASTKEMVNRCLDWHVVLMEYNDAASGYRKSVLVFKDWRDLSDRHEGRGRNSVQGLRQLRAFEGFIDLFVPWQRTESPGGE
jgi:hypothetical protein